MSMYFTKKMSNPDITPTLSSNNDQNLQQDLLNQNSTTDLNNIQKSSENTSSQTNLTNNSENSISNTTNSSDTNVSSNVSSNDPSNDSSNDSINDTSIDNQRISPNILINNLRSIFNDSKDKFSCDQIQDVMNILCDLDQEICVLQTNNNTLNKQTNLMNLINQNIHSIIDKIEKNNQTSQNVVCDNGVCTIQNNTTNSKVFETDSQNIDTMAEKISTMVVQKLQELDEDTNE